MDKSKSFHFEQKIKCFIEEHQLLTPEAVVLIGVSGGPDSVALLISLYKLGYQVVASHVNYHLRGEESDMDENLVRELCQRFDIRFHGTSIDTIPMLRSSKKGMQELARDLRYAWYSQCCAQLKINYVATGHHLDDQAETLLFNIIRGAGVHGAQGILVSNRLPVESKSNEISVKVIRPFLSVRKVEIQAYLDELMISYRVDQTNLQSDYTRNKIRHQVIPLLEKIQPGSTLHLQQFAMRMQAIQPVFNQWRDDLKKQYEHIEGEVIRVIIPDYLPSAAIYEMISPYGFNEDQINQMIVALQHRHKGRTFYSPLFTLITADQCADIFLTTAQTIFQDTILQIPTTISHQGYTIHFELKPYRNESADSTFYLDLARFKEPLLLRYWQAGDRMAPIGMSGKTKKIKDILTDKKISGVRKRQTLVLCSGKDILWCWPGNQISEYVKTTTETLEALQITILQFKDF